MSAARPAAAFYCMSSAAYFLGAVGMINSLRLIGHEEPIYLLDLGLTDAQRELLATEVTVVPAPPGTQPWLAKTIAPLAHPAETMVLIDADVIVIRSLEPWITRAAGGRVIAFEDGSDRFVPEWGHMLDLGEVPRRPYVNSGLVFCGGEVGAEVLRLLDDRQPRVDFERSHFGADETDYALRFLDQDVLNAILQSRVEGARFETLDHRLAAATPFGGLEVADEISLRCAYPDGFEPQIVHFILPAKPWQRPMYHGVYSQLLKRLLVGPSLAIEVPPAQIPLRFRDGPAARMERGRILARDRIGWLVRGLLPERLLERLDEVRRRRAVKPR